MIEFETETEQFLYEERKQFLKERDEARLELREFKQSSKERFSVSMLCLISEDDPLWISRTHNATMHITKGSCSLTLDSDEIKEMVKCADGNFKRLKE